MDFVLVEQSAVGENLTKPATPGINPYSAIDSSSCIAMSGGTLYCVLSGCS